LLCGCQALSEFLPCNDGGCYQDGKITRGDR